MFLAIGIFTNEGGKKPHYLIVFGKEVCTASSQELNNRHVSTAAGVM